MDINAERIIMKEYWDELIKLRDDMLNDYRKEIGKDNNVRWVSFSEYLEEISNDHT